MAYKPRLLTTLLFISCCSSGLLSCDYFTPDTKQITNVIDSLQRTAADLKESTKGYSNKAQTMAEGEIQKLFKIEYKIIQIDSSMPKEELETKLATLGADRWDCSPFRAESGVQFVCKRLPISYLKLLPYVL